MSVVEFDLSYPSWIEFAFESLESNFFSIRFSTVSVNLLKMCTVL